MKMKLKTLDIHDFKCVTNDIAVPFFDVTSICGENGTGKTTIADAFYWLFCDKNYDGKSNPAILPLDREECEPKVTAILDVDGKEITITKFQTISRTVSGGLNKVALSNKYEFNSVPITARDLKAKLLEYGIDVDKMFLLSHPMAFTNQKTADMRKALFEMALAKSDLQIAQMNDDTKDAAELLENYSMQELDAMNKATKKKADEMCKAIPERIIGLEASKVDKDTDTLYKQKAALEANIAELKKVLAQEDPTAERAMELIAVEGKMDGIKDSIREWVNTKKHDAFERTFAVKTEIADKKNLISQMAAKNDATKTLITKYERDRLALEQRWHTEKEAVYPAYEEPTPFTEKDTLCPTCGQELPETMRLAKVEQYKKMCYERRKKYETDRKVWEENHRTTVNGLLAEGRSIVANAKAANDELKKNTAVMENAQHEIEILETKLKDAIAAEAQDYDGMAKTRLAENADYAALAARKKELETMIASGKTDFSKEEQELDGLIASLDSLNSEIALAENNAEIDRKILELQNEHRDLEQKKADAEKILYQLSLVSRRKNDVLVEEINSHFSIVKWQLFDYQKNGEYKGDVCVPMIDGKRFGESLNTGREILGKLDICQSLQKFYDTYVPIFLDNAESLNEYNVPELETQLVRLTVTEDKSLQIR